LLTTSFSRSAPNMSSSSPAPSPTTPQEATTPPTPVVESEGEESDTAAPDEKKAKKKSKSKKKKKKAVVQSDPPRVGLSQIYKDNVYPEGETQEYINEYVLLTPGPTESERGVAYGRLPSCVGRISNAYRTSSAEKRELEKADQADPEKTYNDIRRGAQVHRLVRAHARKTIKPGMTMTEIVQNIEDGTRALVEENGMQSGIGFPTGVSINECAAHFSTSSPLIAFCVSM
jgi:methionyl aminopeptidase